MEKIRWTIGICDDEKYHRDEIERYCEKYQQYDTAVIFNYIFFEGGTELIEYDKAIDILFMDIELGEMSAMDIIDDLRRNKKIWHIIFVTGHSEMSLDCYGNKTIGFVIKPIVEACIFKCLDRAKKEYLENIVIEFPNKGDIRMEKLEDIIYLEGKGNYVSVKTLQDEFWTYGTPKYWEERLKEHNIIRVHKSYLLNLEYVQSIDNDRNLVKIRETEEVIKIGKTHKKELNLLYRKYRLDRAKGWLI